MLNYAIDFMVRPQMERFAFARVLRMPRAEFLRGSRLAAIATHDAMHTALHSEDGAGTEALARLADDGCLASPLHQELMREIQRGRAASTACLSAGRQHLSEPAADAEPAAESVLRLMRAKLAEQASEVADGEATLTNIRLVAGMHRSLAEASGGLAGHHRLHVGSHLLVVDDQPDGLWRVERQRQLLLSRGCCVQLEVAFGGRDSVRPARSHRDRSLAIRCVHYVHYVRYVRTTVCLCDAQVPPQRFLFEAAVDGDALRTQKAAAEEGRGVDDADLSELAVSVADLNGVANGGRFWDAASEIGFFGN